MPKNIIKDKDNLVNIVNLVNLVNIVKIVNIFNIVRTVITVTINSKFLDALASLKTMLDIK